MVPCCLVYFHCAVNAPFSLCRTSQLSVCAVPAGCDWGRAALGHHWPAAWLICQRPSGLQSPHSRLNWCCTALAGFQWSGVRVWKMGRENLAGSWWCYNHQPAPLVSGTTLCLNMVQNPRGQNGLRAPAQQLWQPSGFVTGLPECLIKAVVGLYLQSMSEVNL